MESEVQLTREIESHAATLGTALLLTCLFWACLAIGGVPTWSVLGLAGLASLSAAVNIYARRFRLDAGVVVLLGLAGYTTLQSVFLPVAWLRALDPDVARTWQGVADLVGGVSSASLSLEPFTTRLEALKLVSYAAVWGGVASRVRRWGPVHCARWVVWVATLVAVLVFAHRAAGLHKVYGLYEPDHARTWVGPLLNTNNFAGLCNLGAICAIASSARSNAHPWAAPSYLLAAAMLAAMSVLTGSRGAVLALGAGALLVLVSWQRASLKASLPARLRQLLALGLGAGLATAYIFLALTDDVTKQLSDLSLSKLNLLQVGAKVAAAHPYWGVGRGAFGAEAGTAHELAQAVVFTYTENFVLEWAVGWGIPVALLALAAVGIGMLRIRGGFRTSVLRIGLGTVLLQNLVDLGLELPGVAVPWLVVFAACWGGSTRGTWAWCRLPKAWALVPAVLPCIYWATLPANDVARVDRAKMAVTRQQPEYEQRLAAALRTHPGDAFLWRLGAVHAAETGADDILAWLNAALRRAPSDGRTHLVLAEVLRRKGRTSQALLSLKAAAADPALHREVARRALAWAPQRIMEVVPDEDLGVGLLATLSGAVSDLDQRRALLLEAKRRAPENRGIASALVGVDIARVSANAEECEQRRDMCLMRVRSGIAELERLPEAEREVLVLRAQELLLLNRPRDAFEQLMAGCRRRSSEAKCLTTLLDAGRRLDDEAFKQAATAYLDGICRGGDACTKARLSVASTFSQRQDWASALQVYSAAAVSARTPDAHLGAARAALRLGREREASHWLNKAQRSFGHDAAALERIRATRRNLKLTDRPTSVPALQP